MNVLLSGKLLSQAKPPPWKPLLYLTVAATELAVAMTYWRPSSQFESWFDFASESVQEVLSVKGIALRGAEARIPDNPAQFFFGRAIGHARSSHHVFFQHDGAYVIATEA